jgi:NADH:ubiquinone oxidoreductase subunit F (NADH-binding)
MITGTATTGMTRTEMTRTEMTRTEMTRTEPTQVNPGGRLLPRLLPPAGQPASDIGAHLDRHGPLPYRGGTGLLIPDVRDAGLTGRGGAAFPVDRKLSAVAAAPGQPIVVGNGAEGEPASDKDKILLRAAPHLILDGLQLAAEAVGTRSAVLYVGGGPAARRQLQARIAERAARGLDQAEVKVVAAAPRFLSGQESALASRLSGGAALPAFTPPRVFERGVDGRPTLVQNVETLAHLALIARYGAAWFRAAGTPKEPGTMLCTLRQGDGSASVTEVPIGMPLAALLDLRAAQAVLTGGYHGAWIPAAQAARLPLSNAALRPIGASVGAGVLAALPADRCGLAETARVARYLALESAGQCGPCLNGLPRIAAALTHLAGPRPRPEALADLGRWAGLVEGRGACHHPDGTVRFVRSALRTFSAEIGLHQRGACSAAGDLPFLPVPAGPSAEADWS